MIIKIQQNMIQGYREVFNNVLYMHMCMLKATF